MLLYFSVACRNLVPTNIGVRFRIPLQKLHPLSRAIHHRYSGNSNPHRPPHRTAARYFTSMSRLPMRASKPPPGSGGYNYQQQRNFWVARLAARLLKLRYILLGTAVGGGYTAKKVSIHFYCHNYCITVFKIEDYFFFSSVVLMQINRKALHIGKKNLVIESPDLWRMEGHAAWF